MADPLGMAFAVLVALAGGAGGAELIRAVRDWRAGVSGRHQVELQKLGKQIADERARADRLEVERDEAVNAERVAAKRERLAVEWGHRNAVAAINAGVPESAMPVLDFKDNT